MNYAIDILIVTIPSVAFLVATILATKNITKSQLQIQVQKNRLAKENLNAEKQKRTFTLKLQAYERVVILLERIEPSSIVVRIHKPGMSAKLLHADLLKAIREEFEHNVSQQVYISKNAWQITQQAKEETIKIFNLLASKMEDNAIGIDLSRAIFEKMMQLEKSPSGIAIEYVKKEAKEILG